MNNNEFNQFGLNPTMLDAITKLHFRKPTKIQRRAIPAIMGGKSVIGESHTGSGKTHAFLIPLFNDLNADKREVQFVITSPTRELAQQLYNDVKDIIEYSGMKGEWIPKLVVGGQDRKKMANELRNPPHIIVGTPGRILDLVKDGALSIYTAKAFVVDEADLMLDLGFIEDVDKLLVRSKKDIQILAFSATIPQRLDHFFKKYLDNPVRFQVGDQLVPETLDHKLIALRHRDEADVIMDITKVINPYIALIFTNGKELADRLARSLQEKGLDVGLIHGGLSPRERKRALKQIEDLRYQYVVATDLASRGIDIKGVSHVINAHLPKEEDFYIHRVGRTARAGLTGTAISLYEDNDTELISQLEKKGIEFEYSNIRNGEWVEAKRWNSRELRKNIVTDVEQEAWRRVRKPKKVKPGYRKRMKAEQQAIKRELLKKSSRKKR